MSGRRIDDHAMWAGAKEKGGVFPAGAKMKEVSNVEGAGSVMSYEDTAEMIARQQEMGVSKAKSHPMKGLNRN